MQQLQHPRPLCPLRACRHPQRPEQCRTAAVKCQQQLPFSSRREALFMATTLLGLWDIAWQADAESLQTGTPADADQASRELYAQHFCQVKLSTQHSALLQVKVLEYPTLAFRFQYPVATASGRKLPMVFSRCVRQFLLDFEAKCYSAPASTQSAEPGSACSLSAKTAEPNSSQSDVPCSSPPSTKAC